MAAEKPSAAAALVSKFAELITPLSEQMASMQVSVLGIESQLSAIKLLLETKATAAAAKRAPKVSDEAVAAGGAASAAKPKTTKAKAAAAGAAEEDPEKKSFHNVRQFALHNASHGIRGFREKYCNEDFVAAACKEADAKGKKSNKSSLDKKTKGSPEYYSMAMAIVWDNLLTADQKAVASAQMKALNQADLCAEKKNAQPLQEEAGEEEAETEAEAEAEDELLE
jgi:hypothetical protein